MDLENALKVRPEGLADWESNARDVTKKELDTEALAMVRKDLYLRKTAQRGEEVPGVIGWDTLTIK